MKKVIKTRDYKFVAVIKPAEEGGYYAYCPLIPGCTTQGETYSQTVANIEDAIRGVVEAMVANGDHLPLEAIGDNYVLDIPIKLPKAIQFA